MATTAEVLASAAVLSKDFAKRASDCDRAGEFPLENYHELQEAGLLALTIPEEYGGIGADTSLFISCLAEIGKGCSSTALTLCMHSVIMSVIGGIGSEEQKCKYFGEVIENGKRFASATSEPRSSFQDTFVMESEYEPISGGDRLEGTKHFLSIGDMAHYYAVSGKLKGSTTPLDGWILAMVPKGAGTRVIGDWDSLGMRATNSLSMRFDCQVDHSEVIGAPGALPRSGLFGNFLLGYLGVYLGIAEGALDSLRDFANHRVVPPSIEPMIADPLVIATVDRMEERIKGSQALVGEALRTREEGNKRATLRATLRAKYDVAEGGLVDHRTSNADGGGPGAIKYFAIRAAASRRPGRCANASFQPEVSKSNRRSGCRKGCRGSKLSVLMINLT